MATRRRPCENRTATPSRIVHFPQVIGNPNSQFVGNESIHAPPFVSDQPLARRQNAMWIFHCFSRFLPLPRLSVPPRAQNPFLAGGHLVHPVLPFRKCREGAGQLPDPIIAQMKDHIIVYGGYCLLSGYKIFSCISDTEPFHRWRSLPMPHCMKGIAPSHRRVIARQTKQKYPRIPNRPSSST